MHDSFLTDGGLPQSAGSCEDGNSRLLTAGKVRTASDSRCTFNNGVRLSCEDTTLWIETLPSEQPFPRLIGSLFSIVMTATIRFEFGYNSY